MTIYVVLTNYRRNGYYGAYSTLLNARNAVEKLLTETNDVANWEYVGDYTYLATMKNDEAYWFEIGYDEIDAE